jgi:hypothetical protein
VLALTAIALTSAARSWAAEPVVTMLTDFEDDSVAAEIGRTRNVPAGDCSLERASIPARGQTSLLLSIGATAADTSVACDLIFRDPLRMSQLDRVAAFCWINEGEFRIAFCLKDARGQLFETAPQVVQATRRWVRIAADSAAGLLTRSRGDGDLTWPVQLHGFRVSTSRIGKQSIWVDELQFEHRVAPAEQVAAEFQFNEPTRIYEPASTVGAKLILENRSRTRPLAVMVELSWMLPDGRPLQSQKSSVNLPASGLEYRARQPIDLTQIVRDPGLYRLVARTRISGVTESRSFESTIAVTPSNRKLPRGRSAFFAARSNLLREPAQDQQLEIDVARDVGVHLLAVDLPWRRMEPKRGAYDFRALERIVARLIQSEIVPMIILTDPPEWAAEETPLRTEQVAAFLGALSQKFGEKLTRVQLSADALGAASIVDGLESGAAARNRATRASRALLVFAPSVLVNAESPDDDALAWIRQNPDAPLVLETCGETAAALRDLDRVRARAGRQGAGAELWMHTVAPVAGAGSYADVEDVLRHYLAAAKAGVSGLVWHDLRDDDNDPEQPEALRALVRRDFSPKTALLGYASAASEMTGRRFAGPVLGADDAFESALFIGSDRQVAILLPRTDAALPAVLAPVAGVPGEFDIRDLERRRLPLLQTAAPPLVRAIGRPMFFRLKLPSPQPEPQIALARPWLRLPAQVACDHTTQFEVELDAPRPLVQSYWQLSLPANAPVKADFSAESLRGEPGDTLKRRIGLECTMGALGEAVDATFRVSLEGATIDVPIRIVPAGSKGSASR